MGNTAQKISITWHKCDDCENEMTKANNNYANNAKYIPFSPLLSPFPSLPPPCLPASSIQIPYLPFSSNWSTTSSISSPRLYL